MLDRLALKPDTRHLKPASIRLTEVLNGHCSLRDPIHQQAGEIGKTQHRNRPIKLLRNPSVGTARRARF